MKIPDNILNLGFWITLFFGISFAYFIWLSWQKLTEWIGEGMIIWFILAGIVIVGIILGKIGFNKFIEEFS